MSRAPMPPLDEAWERLCFDLEVRTGFWLTLVVGTDVEAREALRGRARDWCLGEDRPFVLHHRGAEDLPLLAVDLLVRSGESGGLHWIVADGPQPGAAEWLSAAGHLFLAMNERREAYRERLGAGVVIEGQPGLVRELRMLAPDLFSVRAAVLELGASSDPLEESSTEDVRDRTGSFPLLRLTGDSRRAEDRVERLRQATGLGGERALLAALDRAAGTLHWEDRLSRAMVVADEQLATVERLQRRLGSAPWLRFERARALYRRGSITAKTGQWTAAGAWLDEAAALLQSLAESDPLGLAYRRLLARVRRWQWWLAEQRGETELAVQHSAQALGLRRALVEEEPQDAELERLFVHHLMLAAGLLATAERAEQGRALLREAHQRANRRAHQAPRVATWVDEAVEARWRLGELALVEGDLRAAAAAFTEARDDAFTWARALPDDHSRQVWLVETLLGLAGRTAAAGDSDGGRDLLRSAEAALESLRGLGLSAFAEARLQAEVALAQALYATSQGEDPVAAELLRAAADKLEPTLAEPEAPRRLLRAAARLHRRLARLEGDQDGLGHVHLAVAEELLARSAALAPPSLSDLGALRHARQELARLHLDRGDVVAAMDAVRRAVIAAEEAGWRFPGHTRVKPELFQAQRQGARVLLRAGQVPAARELLEEALLVGRDLLDHGGQRLVTPEDLTRTHLDAARLARLASDPTGEARHLGRVRQLIGSGAVDTGILEGLEDLEGAD